MSAPVLFVFGTRPEAIKLAPVIEVMRRDVPGCDVRICVTAQHRQMFDQVLDLFELRPDFDLDLMKAGQDLGDLVTAVMAGIRPLFRDTAPGLVVVQGDTTTAMAAALAAFHDSIPVAHVEAGLRSFDDAAPWPEEVNRKVIAVVTRYHFAPTAAARVNLLREGVDAARIQVTGNTVVDALHRISERLDRDDALRSRVFGELSFLDSGLRLLLVTGHRRESFGAPFEQICLALADLADAFDDVEIVYPVHLNPNVREPVRRILGDRSRVRLIEPADYACFVELMRRSTLILTDSGGVQEEAPALGKPVLVMREKTERPEALDAGNAKLVGSDRETIVREAGLLLREPERLAAMSRITHPFGDGHAAERIVDVIRTAIL